MSEVNDNFYLLKQPFNISETFLENRPPTKSNPLS